MHATAKTAESTKERKTRIPGALILVASSRFTSFEPLAWPPEALPTRTLLMDQSQALASPSKSLLNRCCSWQKVQRGWAEP